MILAVLAHANRAKQATMVARASHIGGEVRPGSTERPSSTTQNPNKLTIRKIGQYFSSCMVGKKCSR